MADHFTQGRIFAAHSINVTHAYLIKPKYIVSQRHSPVTSAENTALSTGLLLASLLIYRYVFVIAAVGIFHQLAIHHSIPGDCPATSLQLFSILAGCISWFTELPRKANV
tara:strand:- start:106 stop:435 length:330 start_codon:yes stop_codon:yes gene_type:complete